MTLVGKILVVLITVFALVFMGFGVTVFTTRSNWKAKYDTEKATLAELQKKNATLDERLRELTGGLNTEIENHKKDRDTAINEAKNQQKNYNDLLARYEQAKVEEAKYANQAKLALEEAASRREEVLKPDDGLRDQLKKAREAREDAVKKEFEATQAKIELTGQFQTAEARRKELEQRVAQLEAILDSRGIPKISKDEQAALIANPPPVEGVVTEIDPDGKFVRISVGSDSGLRAGHKLEIYRRKPDSKYVGRIELTQVDPDFAVGKILPQFRRATIQEGDLVASRITASR